MTGFDGDRVARSVGRVASARLGAFALARPFPPPFRSLDALSFAARKVALAFQPLDASEKRVERLEMDVSKRHPLARGRAPGANAGGTAGVLEVRGRTSSRRRRARFTTFTRPFAESRRKSDRGSGGGVTRARARGGAARVGSGTRRERDVERDPRPLSLPTAIADRADRRSLFLRRLERRRALPRRRRRGSRAALGSAAVARRARASPAFGTDSDRGALVLLFLSGALGGRKRRVVGFRTGNERLRGSGRRRAANETVALPAVSRARLAPRRAFFFARVFFFVDGIRIRRSAIRTRIPTRRRRRGARGDARARSPGTFRDRVDPPSRLALERGGVREPRSERRQKRLAAFRLVARRKPLLVGSGRVVGRADRLRSPPARPCRPQLQGGLAHGRSERLVRRVGVHRRHRRRRTLHSARHRGMARRARVVVRVGQGRP